MFSAAVQYGKRRYTNVIVIVNMSRVGVMWSGEGRSSRPLQNIFEFCRLQMAYLKHFWCV